MALLGLTGCGYTGEIPVSTEAVRGVQINGNVHGGAYPIQNATIRLMETQSNGYGGAGKVLLTTSSDASGYFTFPSTGWTCDAGQYAYITVDGGYSGYLGAKTSNINLIQVGVIGACSADLATVAEINAVNVWVSELSTVAAAYTLGNFITVESNGIVDISAPAGNMSTPGCTGTGSAMTCQTNGLGHAFTNATNLVDSVRFDGSFPAGIARSVMPTNAYSVAPAYMINTIADILQPCVDSSGASLFAIITAILSDGTPCGVLFQYTTPAGGTTPTSTLGAAINLARYPTANGHAAQLFAFIAPNPPFTPALITAPSSYTLAVIYGLGCVSGGCPSTVVPYPVDVTLDYNDNAYVLFGSASSGNTYTAVDGFSPAGSFLFQGAHNASFTNPTHIATDTAGHIFTTNNASSGALLMANTGTGALSKVASLNYAAGLAVDRSNNVWASAADTTDASISQYTAASLLASTGAATAAKQSKVFGVPVAGLALDTNGNVWGVSSASSGRSSAVVFANSGTAAAPAYTASTGSLTALPTYAGASVALNSASTAYFPLLQELVPATFASPTITISSGNAVGASASNLPTGSEVDGDGDVLWADSEDNGSIYRYQAGATIQTTQVCFPNPNYCFVPNAAQPAYYRSMAIDSAGDLWIAATAPTATATYGAVIEMLGFASPTNPQLSYGKPGLKPGN